MKTREDWLRTNLESQWRALQNALSVGDTSLRSLSQRNVQLIQEALGIPEGSIHPDSGGYNNKGVYTGKGKYTKNGEQVTFVVNPNTPDERSGITGDSFAAWFV